MYLLSTVQPTIRPDRCSIPESSSLLFHRGVCPSLSLSPAAKNKQHECRVNRRSRCGKERRERKEEGRWRKKEAADIHIYGERRGKGLDRSRFRSDQIGRGWHR